MTHLNVLLAKIIQTLNLKKDSVSVFMAIGRLRMLHVSSAMHQFLVAKIASMITNVINVMLISIGRILIWKVVLANNITSCK
jgi:hypothetical protein